MKPRWTPVIINEINFKNFGIYKGEHVFNFRVEPSKQNVVLINAKNGSGKTTLLIGIKIALYGPLTMGFRHVNSQYNAYIMDKVNIDVLKEDQPEASIQLDFTMGGYGTSDHYLLERSWSFASAKLVEKLQIIKNDVKLFTKEVLEFENYIRKFFPPSLFDFFLFDGEQIHHQLEEGNILNSIRDAFYSLFNLDLTVLLQQDLQAYLKQERYFKNLNEEQRKYNKLSDKYNTLLTKLNGEKNEIQALEQKGDNLRNETNKLELEFKSNDGLAAEERNKARQDLVKFERKKQEQSDLLKNYIAEKLPFYIAKDLLFDAQKHVILESKQKAVDILNNYVWDELQEHYFKFIKEKNLTGAEFELWDTLTEALKQFNDPLPFHHDLNESEKAQLISLSDELREQASDTITQAQNSIDRHNKRIYRLRKKIEVNEENEDLNNLLQKINMNNQSLLEVMQLKSELEHQYNETSETIEMVMNDLANAEKSLQQSHIDEKIFSIAIRIEKILAEFQKEVSLNKTEALKASFLDCFNSLNHKDNLIHDAEFLFEKKTFVIKLFNQNYNTLKYSQLSSGEKQIFLLSLTWALLKTSQREVPLFFDTLLGRLDHDHRKNIINNFLPHISKQVVVLSTDTEINDSYYELLKPHIAMEYKIHANSGTKSVISIEKISKGYKEYAI